jgi:LuxR family transcriptional regulator, maltose regulon positive regulatory protein
MTNLLLESKFRIPPQSPHNIRRQHLIDALEHGTRAYKLTVISAPAGYGKSTILAQWAHASDSAIAWVSISKDDNDIERFLRYLMAAWAVVQPSVQSSPLASILGAMSPEPEAVLSAFIGTADARLEPLVIVLDDYHLIENPSIHQSLIFLLDHLPASIHFVLAGRGQPPLPLARYRAHHEMLELGAEDLKFLLEETADFLNRVMSLDLTDDEIVDLQVQLEGWIAGLQLVALSRKRRLNSSDKLSVSGKHRFIADFLNEDVLKSLASDMRMFLLRTSILERLCGTLCEAVTGNTDSQAMLEAVERGNLFLMPLDDSRQWFRYHRLFADFLHEELGRRHPDQMFNLHRRAARWYLAHDLPEEAFRHALEAQDIALIIEIFDRYLFEKVFSGEFRVAMQWLDSLPEEWYSNNTVLGIDRAASLVATGALDAGARRLNVVEQQLALKEDEDSHKQMARASAVRCFIACFQNDLTEAETYADLALRDLPEEDLLFRADIYHALGDTYRYHGRWDEAQAYYRSALGLVHAPVFRNRSVHVFGALADLELRQGRLRDSMMYWNKALAIIQERESWGSFPLPLIGWVYIRLGEILYEWNEFDQARHHVSRGLELAELGGDVRALTAGCVIAGRLELAAGDIPAAAEFLKRARPLIEQTPFPDWISYFERFQVDLWLAQDELKAAVDWADVRLEALSLGGISSNLISQVTIARVFALKAEAVSLTRTLSLLERLIQLAESDGRLGLYIEALGIEALVHWRRGETTNAMTSLERALRLAQHEGYMRLFIDLGLPMIRLLQEVHSRRVMPDYVTKLLATFSPDVLPAHSAQDWISEPLTSREQEILQLLAAGLTNQEIAKELVISPETVKKHTGSIYSKLNVSNRTEAAARARVLNLLS